MTGRGRHVNESSRLGFRGETKTLDQMKKRVEFDLWYMENWNLWLDIKIMFLTVFNTIKGEENAF